MTEIDKNTSDGYHTFDELYLHRHHLFIALLISRPYMGAWRSKLHADGSMYPGWFIAGINLPTGPISYHLPIGMWEMMDRHYHIETLAQASQWDGHTPDDVVKRLHDWIVEQ